MRFQIEDKISPSESDNHHDQPKAKSQEKFSDEDKASGLIWRTFVGNKKKEDFLKSSILLLIVINGILGFFLYTQKTQTSVYVIDEGVPKLASLVESEIRVDEQITFFVKMWMKMLMEVNGNNYEETRETLKAFSGQELVKRILTAESSAGNRLLKELIQNETMRLKVADVVIEKIERRGSIFDIPFSVVIQIDVPDGSERYVTNHRAEVVTTSYSLNGLGLAMVNLDNIWKLERRID